MDDNTRKAIEYFSEQTSARMAITIDLKMLQMENRIVRMIEEKVGKEIIDALGATPEKHRQAHDKLSRMSNVYTEFTKKLTTLLLSGALGLMLLVGVWMSNYTLPPAIVGRDNVADKTLKPVNH